VEGGRQKERNCGEVAVEVCVIKSERRHSVGGRGLLRV
jgi:hypothetical protein